MAHGAVHRALARIPKAEADQARQAQLARLQAVRMLLWNQVSADVQQRQIVEMVLDLFVGHLLRLCIIFCFVEK